MNLNELLSDEYNFIYKVEDFRKKDLTYIDNNPEEINDCVEEMNNLIDKNVEINKNLQKILEFNAKKVNKYSFNGATHKIINANIGSNFEKSIRLEFKRKKYLIIILMKKIKLYADGLNPSDFGKDLGVDIDGYTFNPSLFKKNGAKDYLDYSKKILEKSENKPVSLEVFADDEINMIKQAKILSRLGKNVYVKIPITFTNKTLLQKF